jgi:lysine-specific demethylase/histidyl-hydroxylase NO66
MQNWAWVDFLETLMPEALEAAASKSVSLRSGLPRNFLSYMGTMYEQLDANPENMPEALKHLASRIENEDADSEDREADARRRNIIKMQDLFKAEAKKKVMRVCKEALELVTIGCDQMAKRFLSDRLPPAFTAQELSLTSENRAENGGKIWPNTMVRLAKPGIAHLVIEDGKAVLYHNADNSRVYHETPLSPLEFEIDDAPALEALITTVEPHWICVRDLLHGDIEDKMDIAQSLYDEGILAIFQSEAPDTSVQTG